MHFAGLNVVRAQQAHAVQQRCLIKILGILVLLLFDQKLGHDSINAHMQWVEWAPMMVQNRQRSRKIYISLGQLVVQVVSLHHYAIELD